MATPDENGIPGDCQLHAHSLFEAFHSDMKDTIRLNFYDCPAELIDSIFPYFARAISMPVNKNGIHVFTDLTKDTAFGYPQSHLQDLYDDLRWHIFDFIAETDLKLPGDDVSISTSSLGWIFDNLQPEVTITGGGLVTVDLKKKKKKKKKLETAAKKEGFQRLYRRCGSCCCLSSNLQEFEVNSCRPSLCVRGSEQTPHRPALGFA